MNFTEIYVYLRERERGKKVPNYINPRLELNFLVIW